MCYTLNLNGNINDTCTLTLFKNFAKLILKCELSTLWGKNPKLKMLKLQVHNFFLSTVWFFFPIHNRDIRGKQQYKTSETVSDATN